MIHSHHDQRAIAGSILGNAIGGERRTLAKDEAKVLIFGPKDTRNTGDIVDPMFSAPMGGEI